MSAISPDTTTPETLGLPKDDYSFRANPRTEVSGDEYEALAVCVAAMSHTAPRAIVHVDADASAPSITKHRAMWGDTAGVAPTLTRTSAGKYVLTWEASYPDLNPTVDRQTDHFLNFEMAHVTPVGAVACSAAVEWTANSVTISTFDSTDAAADIDFVVSVY